MESVLEEKLWRILTRSGLPLPARQFEVVEGGVVLARLDFAYPRQKIAIECDGIAYHFGRAAWNRDRRRLNNLVVRGWRVLRITWLDVTERPKQVTAQIDSLLG